MEYKPCGMHLQADHLSNLSEEMGASLVDEMLINDNFFVVTSRLEYLAGIMEFSTIQQLSREWTKDDRRKVGVNNRHFVIVGHRCQP